MHQRLLFPIILLTFQAAVLNAQSPESFFPSQVGNLWQYYSPNSDENMSWLDWKIVRDSTASNGDRYLFTVGRPYLYRLDSLFNVYENWSNGSEDHVYKLDADSGEAWMYLNGQYYWVWVSDIYPAYVFNIPTTVKVFRYGPEYPDSIWSDWYYVEEHLASGFGMIYHWEEPDYVAFLSGCVVNGDTFGYVVSSSESLIELPTSASLLQNYPNPFNPITTIRYDLSAAAEVNLAVYDLMGRQVKILVNARQPAGNYSIKFDGSDLSSGLYFYQLETDHGFLETRKMILMK